MLSIDEALAAVINEAQAMAPDSAPLADALGCVLAEDVMADADSPPFDKSVVDGYAVRTADLRGDHPSLTIGETIIAGRAPSRALAGREAAVIMTGAPIPPGCDAVVMHERTRTADGFVTIEQSPIKPGQNLLPRGAEMRSGEIVLARGCILNPPQLGLLASVGKTVVSVIPRPRVSIVPTGDELVEPGETPGPGQIRNSNAMMLRALAVEAGAVACSLPIARDERALLEQVLEKALDADVVLVTGGVSAGQRDLVPDSLAALGVRQVFHKINLKPGKPLWFGVAPARHGRTGALVFGLPGNPVSGLVGFMLFVNLAIQAKAGRSAVCSPLLNVKLDRGFSQRGDRVTYHPACFVPVRQTDGTGLRPIKTLDWAGSADLRTVARADGFAVFPSGDRNFEPGEIVGFLPISSGTVIGLDSVGPSPRTLGCGRNY
jgi:molybdopterin molybdotransferase